MSSPLALTTPPTAGAGKVTASILFKQATPINSFTAQTATPSQSLFLCRFRGNNNGLRCHTGTSPAAAPPITAPSIESAPAAASVVTPPSAGSCVALIVPSSCFAFMFARFCVSPRALSNGSKASSSRKAAKAIRRRRTAASVVEVARDWRHLQRRRRHRQLTPLPTTFLPPSRCRLPPACTLFHRAVRHWQCCPFSRKAKDSKGDRRKVDSLPLIINRENA